MPDRDSALEYLSKRTRSLERRGRIRPMTSGEMMDTAFKFFRLTGWRLVQHYIIPALLICGVLSFAGAFLLPVLSTTESPDNIAAQVAEVVVALGALLAVGIPLIVMATSNIAGVVTFATSEYLCGNEVDDRRAREAANRSMAPMLGPAFMATLWMSIFVLGSFGLLLASALFEQETTSAGLMGIAGVLGLLASLFIVPIILSRYALVPSIVVLEGLKGRAAIKRSVALMKNQKNVGSGYTPLNNAWVVLPLLWLILWGGFAAIFGFLNVDSLVRQLAGDKLVGDILVRVVASIPTLVPLLFILPVWSTMTTLLYYDRRTRLEGYDIAMLAEDATHAKSRLLA